MADRYFCVKCGKSGTPEVIVVHQCKPKNPMVSDITLRDYFAGQALAGFCADPSITADSEQIAPVCYKFADSMLKAREVK